MGTHLRRSRKPVGNVPSDEAGRSHQKKKRFRPWELFRQDVAAARERYRRRIRRLLENSLVFVDETGINRSLARTHGWSVKGEPIVDYKPNSKGTNHTVVGAVKRDRVLCHSVFEGSLTHESWYEFVRDKLAPRLEPGDIVLFDNLKIHYDTDALELIRGVGAEVQFLPPYSPDFNPIEPVWAYMKQKLKSIAERDPKALPSAVWRALLSITERLLGGWFRHCHVRAQVN